MQKVEIFNKELIVKDLKKIIKIEINELKRNNEQLSITTIKKSIEQLEMTANRIKFGLYEYKNAT